MLNFFNRLRVGQRLALGFAAVVLSTVVVAVMGLSALRSLTTVDQAIATQRVEGMQQARDVRDNVNQIANSVRAILLAEVGDERDAMRKRINETRTANTALLENAKQLATTQEEHELLGKITAARAPFNKAADKVIEAGISGGIDLAKDYMKSDLIGAQSNYGAAIDAYVAHQATLYQASREQARKSAERMALLMIGVTLLAIGGAAVLGWLVTKSVTRPLGGEPDTVSALAKGIAGGDLSQNIDVSRSAPDSLMASMALMQKALRDVVAEVRSSSDSIASGTSEIASGNLDLSQRTERQASSLQQTAASMEQLTGTVRQNTELAQAANRLATNASQAAEAGGARVAEVVTTMESIAASSRQIAEIISVIDGIAFQTNILALNAAVEAARAGEQGRGFAVVASEVRSLAQRSAHAAKDIKSLIGAGVERVSAGTQQVGQAGAVMQDIVRQVHEVSRMLGDISGANVQQTTGIEQVNAAVTELDESTQQNAALVEEGAAAAQSLNQQAERLQQTVAIFKIA